MSEQYDGVLLLNKLRGISSHDAVVMVRRAIKQRSIGHTGTLDPLAEGLLVLCLGRSTRLSQFISDCDKCYEAEITLGIRSETGDAEGVSPNETSLDISHITPYQISEVLGSFRGEITQQVPLYSAVRVDGERLYKSARRGETVERPSRQVCIHKLQLLGHEENRLFIFVRCSKGTYIRSLAVDIGEKLGCGAYLSGLKRSHVGMLSLSKSVNLSEIRALHQDKLLQGRLLSAEDVLHFGAITIHDTFLSRVANGVVPLPQDIAEINCVFSTGERILLQSQSGKALAVAKANYSSEDLMRLPGTTNAILSYERVLS
ncbi:MAG: tRNA pseudouridine(55) synthase TruB [candidate division Zixibacteria bacterium]|nr:tRNA pseudouridine(55) synthase TruB [candidate division Zixibacteria bacterium]